VLHSCDPKFRYWPWLLAGMAIIGASFGLDERVGAMLDTTQNPALHQFAWWCSKLGEGWVIAVAGILFSAIYFATGQTQSAAKIFFVALASELIGLASVILRLVFGRARPNNHDVSQGFYWLYHDGHWVAGMPGFSSFPSGHSATAAGLVVAAWLVHRGWSGVLAAYALAVMWSRIALEAHHLSDVLASILLAVLLAGWLKRMLLPPLESGFDKLHCAWHK
jgi:membrane-associated phospholipid phosphatase